MPEGPVLPNPPRVIDGDPERYEGPESYDR
jgi:hypothetical protein